MSAEITKRVLLDVLETLQTGRAGRFERWAERNGTRKALRFDADVAKHFVKAYGGIDTVSALRAARLERLYTEDLAEVVGERRARKALSRIDFQNGAVRDQPLLRSAFHLGRVAVAGCVAITLWNVVQSRIGPAEAEASSTEIVASDTNDSEHAESDTASGEADDEDADASEETLRLPSCEMYATMRVQLRCFNAINNLAGQTIAQSSENRDAFRKMSMATSAYAPSMQCRTFEEAVEGMAMAQAPILANQLASSGALSNDAVVSGCADLYGEAVSAYCGGGSCAPD